MPNGDGGGGLGGLLSGLSGLLSGDNAPIWRAIYKGVDYSFSTVNGLAGFLRSAVDSVKNIVKNIWDNVIKAVLIKILDAYRKLRDLLHRIFDPVIRILKRLRQIYDSYFNRFVKPMLRILRQIRQVLQIFRLLGFKWAKRLDADLAFIENKIVKAYELIRQNLNQVISWLDLIVDPTFLLRRSPLFGALIRSAPELRNLMLQQITTPLSPEEQARQDAARGRYTRSGYTQRQADAYSQGNLPDDAAASLADFRAKASAYLAS